MNTSAHAMTAPRNLWRSTGAVVLAIVVVFAVSLGTDQLLHALEVYPPWGEPMWDNGLNALALSYRIVYGILGGYVAARFAPRNAMRHAMVVGAIGFVLSVIGAIGAIAIKAGPPWYPIALALTAIPCAWVGGMLHARRHSARLA